MGVQNPMVRCSMTPKISHSWTLSEEEAHALQRDWARKVAASDQIEGTIGLVAGVDVAYAEERDRMFAAVVVLDAVTLETVETGTADETACFPYIPGLFSFREIPSLVRALGKLTLKPDLIVCDGQGIAHPRRFGLASHLGVMFDLPTIGCAKTRLLGESAFTPKLRGEFAPLCDGPDVIGSVLCTQDAVKPVYVSIGHRISLETARSWILRLTPKYRLPETTRVADQTVNKLRRDRKETK